MSNRETWIIHNLTANAVEIDGAGIVDGGSSKTVEGIVSRERIAQSAYVLSLLQADDISIDLQVDGATVETVTSANASTALLPARLSDLDEGGIVTSVAGRTGAVTLDTDDIDGLDTALASKAATVHTHIISDVTNLQPSLDAKAGASTVNSHIANTSNPHSVTKSQVGLANVDNTSDANKPVSTATQSALDAKLNLSGGTLTGNVTVQAPASVGGTKADTGFSNTYVTNQATLTTTNATPTSLFTVAIANGQTMTIEVAVNATSTDYAHSIGGTMVANFARNSGGTISQVGVTNTIMNTTTADEALDFDIDINGGAIRTFVTGQAGRTYHWGAVYRVTTLSHS